MVKNPKQIISVQAIFLAEVYMFMFILLIQNLIRNNLKLPKLIFLLLFIILLIVYNYKNSVIIYMLSMYQ